MRYALIRQMDISNGKGVGISLFVQGCHFHCKGCFNPETWDFDYGKPYTEDTLELIIQYLEPYYINGLTILGGDPLCGDNTISLIPLLETVKKKYPEKNIWVYTGDTIENIIDMKEKDKDKYDIYMEFLKYVDVLVDGPFIESEKDLALRFRGSSNQRIIDVKKTLKAYPKIVLSSYHKS